jgi:hypothetical protein
MGAWQRFSTAILVMVFCAGCDGARPTAPTAPVPPPVDSRPPVPPALGGQWEGLSTVESITGVAPSCIAPFWRPASTHAISAQLRAIDASSLDMVLHQPASEDCHVRVTEFQDRVTGGSWPYDEFDCAMVPSLCGLGCHFRLQSSEWNCEGPPPDVWILGVGVAATIAGESQDRMQGTMTIAYDHRPGNYPVAGGGYREVTVVTRFDIRKISR